MLSVRETAIGWIAIEEEDGRITRLDLPNQAAGRPREPVEETPLLREAFRQLDLYLEGKLRVFTLPLKLEGSSFMERAWKKLAEVPYGQTITYGELAAAAGNPRAARAAGMACARNPIALFVPCHRVVGAGGRLVGFGGGLDLKSWLLEHEARHSGKSGGQ
jgi:methylated-DNA-[protein]-cysteine S-methyltransferase